MKHNYSHDVDMIESGACLLLDLEHMRAYQWYSLAEPLTDEYGQY